MIRVESVKIVETNRNYKDVFHALFLLDLIVSDGQITRSFEVTDLDINILNDLLINDKMSSFDKYIEMTVKSFIKNKKQITINMYGLHRMSNKELVGFIIEDEVRAIEIKYTDYDKIEFKFNLVSSKIFNIFPSATTIIINHGIISYYKYIFDLFLFLEIISKSKTWNTIKIKEKVYEENKNTSWLYSYHNKCSSNLESEYQKQGLTIQFDSIPDNTGGFNEYLIICRM